MALGVVLICLILMNMYNKNNKEVYNSTIKDIINEIKYDDLDNYLQENPNAVLYINDSSVKNSNIEKEFKKLIINNNVQQYVVYIERNKSIVEKLDLNSNTPIFIAYKDGKKEEVFSKSEYTSEEIKNFLVRNGVIDND